MAYQVSCIEAGPDGNHQTILPRTYTFEDALQEAKRLRRRNRNPEADYIVAPYAARLGRDDLMLVYFSEDSLL
jgi:hypothetical protein